MLLQKLKIDLSVPWYLLNAPEKWAKLLIGDQTLLSLPAAAPEIGQVLLFVHDRREAETLAWPLGQRMSATGLCWIAYPKKSGSLHTDISRDEGWEGLLAAGWEPVTIVALDDDWSALRFRQKSTIKEYIRAVPMNERRIEGVDFEARTVQLPPDAVAALAAHEGLSAFFDAYSFSHKKEYAEAIAEAKKPETRVRRIHQMVEMLLQQMAHKKARNK